MSAGPKTRDIHPLKGVDGDVLLEVFANAQDDLKPLEIGLHVLKSVGDGKPGRGKKGGAAQWAQQMGHTQQTVADWVCAAKVAKSTGHPVDLFIRKKEGDHDYTSALSIIHRADTGDWPALVAAMLKGGWSIRNHRGPRRGREAVRGG